MKEIRRIGILSMAKINALVSGVLGLLIGLIYSMIFGVMLAVSGNAILGILAAIGMLIGIPIAYAGIGFVMGALLAWVYNVVADRIGGIEIELK